MRKVGEGDNLRVKVRGKERELQRGIPTV